MTNWYPEYVEVCRQVDRLTQMAELVEGQFANRNVTITKLSAENTFLRAEGAQLRITNSRLASQLEHDTKVIRELRHQLQLQLVANNGKRERPAEISQGHSDDPSDDTQSSPSKIIKIRTLGLGFVRQLKNNTSSCN